MLNGESFGVGERSGFGSGAVSSGGSSWTRRGALPVVYHEVILCDYILC